MGVLVQDEHGASSFLAAGMDMLKDGTSEETYRVWFDILNRFGHANLEKITAIMSDRAASQGRL